MRHSGIRLLTVIFIIFTSSSLYTVFAQEGQECPGDLYFIVKDVQGQRDNREFYFHTSATSVLDCIRQCFRRSNFCFSVGFTPAQGDGEAQCLFSYHSAYNCTRLPLVTQHDDNSREVIVDCIRCPAVGELVSAPDVETGAPAIEATPAVVTKEPVNATPPESATEVPSNETSSEGVTTVPSNETTPAAVTTQPSNETTTEAVTTQPSNETTAETVTEVPSNETTPRVCDQQVTYIAQTVDAGTKLNLDTVDDIESVDACAQKCYETPGCTRAGYLTPVNETQVASCFLSFEEATDECVGERVSGIQPPDGALLITCIRCASEAIEATPATQTKSPTETIAGAENATALPTEMVDIETSAYTPETVTYAPRVLSEAEQEAETLSPSVIETSEASTAQDCINQCSANAACNSAIYVPSTSQCYQRMDTGECQSSDLVSNFTDTGEAVWFQCINYQAEEQTEAVTPSLTFNTPTPMSCEAGVATFQQRQLSNEEQELFSQQLADSPFRIINSTTADSAQECVDLCAAEPSCNSALFLLSGGPSGNLTQCIYLASQGECGDGGSANQNITILQNHVFLECIRCPGQEIAPVIEATPSVLEKTSAVPVMAPTPTTCGPGEVTYYLRLLEPTENVTFPTINETRTDSWQSCADECAADAFCNSVIFMPTTNQCLLMAGEGFCVGPPSSPNETFSETQPILLDCLRCPGQEVPKSALINLGPAICEPGQASFLPRELAPLDQPPYAAFTSTFVVNTTNTTNAQECIDQCGQSELCKSAIFVPRNQQCYHMATVGICQKTGFVSTYEETDLPVWFECMRCPEEGGPTIAPIIEASPAVIEKTSLAPPTPVPISCEAGVATFNQRQLTEDEQLLFQQETGQFVSINTTQANSAQDCVDECASNPNCNSAVFVLGPFEEANICFMMVNQGECGDGGSLHQNISVENQHVLLDCIRCPGQEIATAVEQTTIAVEATTGEEVTTFEETTPANVTTASATSANVTSANATSANATSANVTSVDTTTVSAPPATTEGPCQYYFHYTAVVPSYEIPLNITGSLEVPSASACAAACANSTNEICSMAIFTPAMSSNESNVCQLATSDSPLQCIADKPVTNTIEDGAKPVYLFCFQCLSIGSVIEEPPETSVRPAVSPPAFTSTNESAPVTTASPVESTAVTQTEACETYQFQTQRIDDPSTFEFLNILTEISPAINPSDCAKQCEQQPNCTVVIWKSLGEFPICQLAESSIPIECNPALNFTTEVEQETNVTSALFCFRCAAALTPQPTTSETQANATTSATTLQPITFEAQENVTTSATTLQATTSETELNATTSDTELNATTSDTEVNATTSEIQPNATTVALTPTEVESNATAIEVESSASVAGGNATNCTYRFYAQPYDANNTVESTVLKEVTNFKTASECAAACDQHENCTFAVFEEVESIPWLTSCQLRYSNYPFPCNADKPGDSTLDPPGGPSYIFCFSCDTDGPAPGQIIQPVDMVEVENKTDLVCGENEIPSECGAGCQATCLEPLGPEVCATVCVPGCVCASGFVRHNNGSCVPPAECRALGNCMVEAAEAAQIPQTYVPQCFRSGFYHPLQCNKNNGECWCVDPRDGAEISGTRTSPGLGVPKCEQKVNHCNEPNVTYSYMETNISNTMNYYYHEPNVASLNECATLCFNDPPCKTATYAPVGLDDSQNQCHLSAEAIPCIKDQVPNRLDEEPSINVDVFCLYCRKQHKK